MTGATAPRATSRTGKELFPGFDSPHPLNLLHKKRGEKNHYSKDDNIVDHAISLGKQIAQYIDQDSNNVGCQHLNTNS